MSINRGKQFEEQFKKDFINTFGDDGFILRLHDQVTGYKTTSKNPCDYICFIKDKLFLIECKSHAGASIPISAISQYALLQQYVNIPGVHCGVICWLYEKDKVLYIPVNTITQLLNDRYKSVGLKAIEQGYNIIEIPSQKKRVFMTSDYNILKEIDYYG